MWRHAGRRSGRGVGHCFGRFGGAHDAVVRVHVAQGQQVQGQQHRTRQAQVEHHRRARAGQASYRANRLFEDRRANAVGDILTININETTAASKKSGSSASRNGTNNLSLAAESSGVSRVDATLAAKSAGTFAGKGDSASNNAFTGIITVTVIEVLPNGNLLVSGEKQIGINQGSEFVRFSGVVNPLWLTAANAISSTRVADARLEYRGNGYVDEAQTMGWLSRFFLSVLPF